MNVFYTDDLSLANTLLDQDVQNYALLMQGRKQSCTSIQTRLVQLDASLSSSSLFAVAGGLFVPRVHHLLYGLVGELSATGIYDFGVTAFWQPTAGTIALAGGGLSGSIAATVNNQAAVFNPVNASYAEVVSTGNEVIDPRCASHGLTFQNLSLSWSLVQLGLNCWEILQVLDVRPRKLPLGVESELNITGMNIGLATAVTLQSTAASQPNVTCFIVYGDTSNLTCRCQPTSTGTFLLLVEREPNYSIPISDSAQQILVESASFELDKTAGSFMGGQVVKITINFSQPLLSQIQVFFGSNEARVVSTDSTGLGVATPPASTRGNSLVEVSVLIQMRVRCDCLLSCGYQYTSLDTPRVLSVSKSTASAGEQVQLSITNAESQELTLVVGAQDVALTRDAATAAYIFSMPALKHGPHVLRVSGLATGDALFECGDVMLSPLAVRSLSPTSGSQFGNVLKIIGNGFVEGSTLVLVGDNVTCNIWSLSATELTCAFHAQLAFVRYFYTVRVLVEGKPAECADCVYQIQPSQKV